MACVEDLKFVIQGTLIDSASLASLRLLSDGVLGVNAEGRVVFAEGGHAESLAPGGTLVLSTGQQVSLRGVQIQKLPPRAFLCPGLVDTHTHAPQFAFAGLGYDLQLLEWLETYTFPSEAKFADLRYAAQVAANAVERTLYHGTTSCVYFGTIHTDAAVILGGTAAHRGQRSFVGKVNMDRNSPDSYRETTEESIRETERFVRLLLGSAHEKLSVQRRVTEAQLEKQLHITSPCHEQALIPSASKPTSCASGILCELMRLAGKALGGTSLESFIAAPVAPVARWSGPPPPTGGSVSSTASSAHQTVRGPKPVPVITPRFVPTCTSALMTALGEISERHQLLIQSHVSENKGEVCWVKELHPESVSYTAVYDDHGLLNSRTLLAHGVYLEESERKLLKARGSTVSHCPMSNAMLRSGMLNVRLLLNEGVSVALGTDVSGGASPSMLSALREALKVSNMVALYEGAEYTPLSYAEAFWLATVGGAQSLKVEGLTGDLSVGSKFDALIVDPDAPGSAFDLYKGDSALEAFQKWLQLGDDRNVSAIYVDGTQVYTQDHFKSTVA